MKKPRVKPTEAWGFMDKESGRILPPDICPIKSTRREAVFEKEKYDVFYENTKIVRIEIRPLIKKKKI